MNQNPSGEPIVMRPLWHDLLFLHWPVPVEIVRALLPPGLEPDVWNGQAYVGLIPFGMKRVRPHWAPPLPAPLSRVFYDFLETNVRTYVRPKNGGARGVWFWSLDAANAPAVVAARRWFKLPYFHALMRMNTQPTNKHGSHTKYFVRRNWPASAANLSRAMCRVCYEPFGEIAPAQPDTLEHFLIERYVLYSQSRGRLFAGRVEHEPYQLQRAKVLCLRENLVAAAGIARPHSRPMAHYSRGVEVRVRALQVVKPSGLLK